MSLGKLIVQTATMIITGKAVNAGIEKGKKKYADYKEKKDYGNNKKK